MSRAVGDVAERLDSFFVDRGVDEAYNRTRLRLRGGFMVATEGDDKALGSVQINLELPRITEGLSLIVSGSRNDEEADASEVAQREGDAKGVTLRYFLLDTVGVRLNADASLHWNGGPNPLFRLRGQREWAAGKSLLRLTQFLFWESKDGAGIDTRVDLDRPFGDNALGRWRNEIQYSQGSDGVEFVDSLLFYHQLDEATGYRLQLSAVGRTEPYTRVDYYLAGMQYRRLIYSTWLYALLEPRLRFARDHDYDTSVEALAQIEILFGREYIDGNEPRR